VILHSLRVTHWRSLLNPVDLGPFSERLNVIHAPNGTGKSSLFEAMRRALFDAHHVSGDEIKAVRPWGRELAPQVHVEFTQSGIRYRIEKTFLDGAAARLLRFENGAFQPLSDSRNADAKLREIMTASDAPGRGLSKPEHWGLAEVLWAPQGSLHLESLSSNVTENLRAALGVQLSGEAGNRLEELLEERYQTYFTKGGKPRIGKQAAPILALEAEHQNTVAERQQRLEHQQRFEETGRAVEDARQKRGQARLEADALRETVTQTRQQAETYLRLQGELAQKRQTEQAAKERFEAIGQSLELIGSAREEITKFQTTIQSGEPLATDLANELKKGADAANEARRKREEARRQRSSLDDRTAEVEDARAYVDDTKAYQTLAARIDKLRRLEADLKVGKDKRATLVAPDEKIIRDVRKFVTAREKAQAALRASLIHLTVQPKKKATVQRQSPDESKNIAAGKSATFSGSPEVRIEIEGFGTIQASGPEGDAEAHEEALQEAESKLTKLTQPYGTQDPDRLQLLREQADEVDRRTEQLEEQISELLGEDSKDELNQQLAEFDARIQERLGRFPAWKKHSPTVSDLKSALEKQRKTIEAAIEIAEDNFEKVQSTAQALEKRHGEADAELKNARLNLEAAQGRLKELTKDGQSDEARTQSRKESLMAWEAAKTKAKDCETKLNEIPGDPQKDLQKLERQLKALEEAETKARDDENRAEGRLQTLAAEGAYTKLVACEEKLADLNSRIRREKLRMDATKLLYDTVASCKAAIVAAVAAPVERAATHMLGRIAGPRLGTVRFTENFVPVGVRPEIAAESVDLANLSGGEQEQLFLITRLALGQVLAKHERQLVVLDDVLNATDTGRLARMLTLLEESADHLQIVILTCHPERYRGMEKAQFFDLQENLKL
jgi:DNA repair exonuclease SbcCD ATPase subunit